jgi:predicted Zn finger-like uncharacterized protein
MPDIITCPSCGGKLRISEELHGQRVRCPACNHTFDSAAETEPPAAAARSTCTSKGSKPSASTPQSATK